VRSCIERYDALGSAFDARANPGGNDCVLTERYSEQIAIEAELA
jgi:hypothetical protein